MTELSRRCVLKSGLLAAVSAGAVVGTTGAKAATPIKTETFDVIVIGCGCAGMAAAIEAKRQGYTACIVDKMSRPAGNTISQAVLSTQQELTFRSATASRMILKPSIRT